MTDERYQVGIWVPLLYVIALDVYAFVQRAEVWAIEPNELGDALAGAASPLAFLWLVLGYLRQGDDLRQNTDALRLHGAGFRLVRAICGRRFVAVMRTAVQFPRHRYDWWNERGFCLSPCATLVFMRHLTDPSSLDTSRSCRRTGERADDSFVQGTVNPAPSRDRPQTLHCCPPLLQYDQLHWVERGRRS